MERLCKNNGRYEGERIEVSKVLHELEQLATASGWESDPLVISEKESLPAFRWPVPNPHARIYISTGIHGDEPAGPLAVLKLFHQNEWPKGLGLWLVPCLNPGAYARNTRENEDGVDLNRDYRSLHTAVVRAHVAWLNRQPDFDISLLLHEDWESNGFYLYELNPRLLRSVAEDIIRKVNEVCPIDTSDTIEGRPAKGGIICANPDLLKRPDWPEAFYLVHHKSPLSYTLESPSDFPLSTRVDALVSGVRAVFAKLENREQEPA